MATVNNPCKGCPRGRMGEAGDAGSEMGIRELDPVTDIEGDVWVPVLAEDLRRLKDKVCKPVVHGRWIEYGWDYGTGGFYWTCSECTRMISDRYGLYKYCPYCGADMREGKDDGN